MKILYYSAHPHLNLYASTGYGIHMREVIEGFKNEGHEVETLIIGGETPPKDNLKRVPQKTILTSLKAIIKKITPSIIWETFKDYQLLKKDKISKQILDEKVKAFQPDLIYERGYYLIQSGITICSKHNIQHYIELNAVYTEERIDFSGRSLFINLAKKIEKKQLLSATKIIVVSSALKNYFLKLNKNVKKEKIIITPNAINPKSVKLNSKYQERIIEDNQLQNQTIIGFVGSIFPYHGVDLLIKAFSNANLTNCKLLIVGDGAILKELKELTISLGVEKHVVFTGKTPHKYIFDYIQLMDITVMPQSNWYGSPVKIFEYGYMEKAIIAPNYQPIKDVLKHRVNSLLISPSVESLTKSIKTLIQDIELRNNISKQVKKDIIENYTWEKVVKKILD